MNELDKRIAEEIMGEKEPVDPPSDDDTAEFKIGCDELSPRGAYRAVAYYDEGDIPRWEPLAFSSDWNYCMKALKQCKDIDFDIFLDPFLEGDDVFIGYTVEVGIAEGSINKDGYADSKVERECHSLDNLPRVLCEAMLDYRSVN